MWRHACFGEGPYWSYGVPMRVNTHVQAFRRRYILKLWCSDEGQYTCSGISEKVYTEATVFQWGSVHMFRRFGEGIYWSYGVSMRVNTHVQAFRRRSILKLRCFNESQYTCSGVSEKVHTHVGPRLRLRCHGADLKLRGSVPSFTRYNFLPPDTVFWIILQSFESSTSLGSLVFNIPHSSHLVPTTFSYAHWCQVVTTWVRLTKSANEGRRMRIFFYHIHQSFRLSHRSHSKGFLIRNDDVIQARNPRIIFCKS